MRYVLAQGALLATLRTSAEQRAERLSAPHVIVIVRVCADRKRP